jgi:hypothetical protein
MLDTGRHQRRDALELMLIGIPDEDATTAAGLPASQAPALRRVLDAMWALARSVHRGL